MPPAPPRLETWPIRVTSPDCMNDAAKDFLQYMMNRMGVSYHKYGSLEQNFPHNRTGVDNLRQRLEKYEETGNLEWLVDAANYALIEFLFPSVEGAHFRPTDSDESPGAVNRDGSIHHGKT